jgi:SAM-dependent methyltransferase
MASDRPATTDDIVKCYRQFLGRQPENVQVVHDALADHPSLWTVIDRFKGCDEALRRQETAVADRIWHKQDGLGIEVSADSAEIQQLIEHIEMIWSRYGRDDAYYSVLTNPSFLKSRITGADIEAFYQTGFETVSHFETICRRNLVDLHATSSVLELGCGVGRLGEAFRQRFANYIGVDISGAHLEIATERFRHRDLSGMTLTLLGDFLSSSLTYDLFYSVIVLQHNPPPIMAILLDACLGRLRPGGYAYFQLPCFLYDYSFAVGPYLRGEGRKDEMEMHALPQRTVFELLAKHGLTPIEVIPDSQIGPIGFSYSFFARKSESGSLPE